MPRVLTVALAAACAAAAFAPGAAQARVVHGTTVASAAGFVGGRYDVGGGKTVSIVASDRLPDPRAEARTWAAFFKGLVHGSEIARIRVRVMPVSEMSSYCGAGADGCYDGETQQLVIPPTSYDNARLVAAHEYGHHLANNRRNPPWQAVDWGTKRWASYENVCARTRAGTAFPGNEDQEYSRNPGEAFAESFAVLNGFGWEGDIYSNTFRPNARALALIRQDVLSPYSGPAVTTRTGRLSRAETSDTYAIPTPLDGLLTVTAAGRGSLDVDLSLFSNAGRRLARSATDSHTETVKYTVCGARREKASVVRYASSGTYGLRISRP